MPRQRLQASYANQALILQAWGRLEEAMALHKKKEALWLELGNKDGSQASYGNQALILKDCGRLDTISRAEATQLRWLLGWQPKQNPKSWHGFTGR